MNRIKDIAATSDRILSTEEFFFAMLLELCEDMSQQAVHWRRLSEQLATKTRQQFEVQFETFSALPALLNISALDLFLAIVKSKEGNHAKKNSLYHALLRSPRACAAGFEDSRKEFERFRNGYSDIQDRWDRSVRAIVGFTESRINDANGEVGSEPSQFLFGLAETIGNWQRKGTTEQNLTHEHLLRPLRQHAKQHVGKPESFLLLSLVNEADRIYDEFSILLTFYAHVFDLSALALEERSAVITSKLKEAKELKRRKRWYSLLENRFRQWKEEPK